MERSGILQANQMKQMHLKILEIQKREILTQTEERKINDLR